MLWSRIDKHWEPCCVIFETIETFDNNKKTNKKLKITGFLKDGLLKACSEEWNLYKVIKVCHIEIIVKTNFIKIKHFDFLRLHLNISKTKVIVHIPCKHKIFYNIQIQFNLFYIHILFKLVFFVHFHPNSCLNQIFLIFYNQIRASRSFHGYIRFLDS